MKIAQIAPIIERVPPVKYGGIERVAHALVEGLMKRGHKVTLFASGDSLTSAKLVSVYPIGLRAARISNLYEANALVMLNIGRAYSMQSQFDIIHDHNGYFSLPTANICSKPVLMTCHGPLSLEARRIYQALKKPFVASISKAQARGVSGINLIANVYNGLSMEHYPYSDTHDGYLLFVGRFSLEKGVHYAIETALYLNLPLIIAAKLDPAAPNDMSYFHQYVESRLSENIRWVGEVTEEERNRLMSRAMCLLSPVTWREPFSLALIEAMACGCPVVAFKRGSVPEIVKHGETGFVVSDIYEMITAVKRIKKISRQACRDRALSNFNAEIMVSEYEKIYQKIK